MKTSSRFHIIAATASLLLASGTGARAQTVNVWLTTDDQSSKLQPQTPVAFSTSFDGGNRLFIDENQTYQQIEGFGASLTDSAGYLLNEVATPAARNSAMASLFSRVGGGIGVSFLRNPMGASDLARWHYSYDDLASGATDPGLTSFSIAHDAVDIIPLLQQALVLNPDLTIMANPWSPPGWMKTSDSMIGGELLPSMYSVFANYFVKYIQAYEAVGIPIHYVSLQNEPLYVPGDYPGMSMDAATQLAVLRDYVLPAFAASNITTRVLIYDHNWDGASYPDTVLSDSTVLGSSQVAGVAWHGYGGSPGAMLGLAGKYPAKGNYLTEHSGGTWVTDPVRADFEEITHVMRCWGKAYVKWSLVLDQNHGPHAGGCDSCDPLVTVNSSSGAVSYNIDFYTLGHFSKFVLPGAYRVYSANSDGLVSAAFLNPDGSKAVVVFNDTADSRSFRVQWGPKQFSYTLAGFAGATFTWTGTQSSSYAVNASSRIQASSFNTVSGLQTEPCSDALGGYDLGYADNYDYAVYRNVTFGAGASSISARVASAGSGTLEVRLDGPTGTRIATLSVPNTGGWQTWQTVSAPVSGASGTHDLYLVFRGGSGIGNLNWFHFSLPSPWNSQDIGSVGAAGDAACDSNAFTVSGSGADIESNADAFRYVHQACSSNCEVRARVTSVQNTDPWAKAGVMIRESTAAGAPYAAVFVTPGNGVTFQRRTSSGGGTTSTVMGGVAAPRWLRIVRAAGNTFSAYYSSDGNSWTQVGASTVVPMAASARVGLAVTAHDNSSACTAVFENVSVNQPPVLSPISDQAIVAGRTLMVTNSGSDPDIPTQSLAYTLLAPPAGASIDTNSGVFSWRPAVAESPAVSAIQVVLSDNGVPSLSDTQSFTVTVTRPAVPELSFAPATNGQFGFSVLGDAGPDYTILASTNLLTWDPVLTTNPPALPFFWADTNTTWNQRFYRIRLGP